MNKWLRYTEGLGSLGAIVSTMGCAMCFPAVAGLGAALGLGFLGRWEGVFINTLLPLFAWLVLIVNVLAWFGHRQWQRTALGLLGPVLLLASLYPLFRYIWSSTVTYSALILMLIVSIWDLVAPAHRRCPMPSADKTEN